MIFKFSSEASKNYQIPRMQFWTGSNGPAGNIRKLFNIWLDHYHLNNQICMNE